MNFSWLTICPEGQTTDCIQPVQLLYLAALVVGVVVLAFIAVRSRDLSTSTLVLMSVSIAINIAVGAIIYALRLPIYLDSIGTVLVGALAGPWAGALTGLLANLIWSILPVPGGAGPTAAFFAPVAAVIGLMAGFWASRGVFQMRSDDTRVGGFVAVAAGIGAAAVGLLVVQLTIGIPPLAVADINNLTDEESANITRFVLISLGLGAVGVVVAWVSGRTGFKLDGQPWKARRYLQVAAALTAGLLIFAIARLLVGPTGYFSGVDGLNDDGTPDSFLGGANLPGLAFQDPGGLVG